jgi:hypothetical protein
LVAAGLGVLVGVGVGPASKAQPLLRIRASIELTSNINAMSVCRRRRRRIIFIVVKTSP